MLNKYPENLDFKFEISMIDCGDLFTIFLAKNGTVYTYGENIGNEFISKIKNRWTIGNRIRESQQRAKPSKTPI